MRLSVISFTEAGMRLAEKTAGCMETGSAALFTKCSRLKGRCAETPARYVEESIADWAGEQMRAGNAILFIGACGIAVRSIAPWITDKLQDRPVLVMDEGGRYLIPLLAGHMGGANELAAELAKKLGAVPVITTATDVRRKFAVDLFAKRNHLSIGNKEGIARVSAKVLAGEEITLSIETGHLSPRAVCPEGMRLLPYPPDVPADVVITSETAAFPALLHLQPREYVIGMGCRRGKEERSIRARIEQMMEETGIRENQIFALASIDCKKDEQGFLAWSESARVPFLTFSAEELRQVQGDFQSSKFVERQVGVDNVCERAALKACGSGGKLVWRKQAGDGMTIAVARREWRVSLDET